MQTKILKKKADSSSLAREIMKNSLNKIDIDGLGTVRIGDILYHKKKQKEGTVIGLYVYKGVPLAGFIGDGETEGSFVILTSEVFDNEAPEKEALSSFTVESFVDLCKSKSEYSQDLCDIHIIAFVEGYMVRESEVKSAFKGKYLKAGEYESKTNKKICPSENLSTNILKERILKLPETHPDILKEHGTLAIYLSASTLSPCGSNYRGQSPFYSPFKYQLKGSDPYN